MTRAGVFSLRTTPVVRGVAVARAARAGGSTAACFSAWLAGRVHAAKTAAALLFNGTYHCVDPEEPHKRQQFEGACGRDTLWFRL